MLDDILTAIPFGIILAFTIGPVFFVLLETGATKGFTRAVIFDLGVIFADIVFIFVIFLSTDTLLDKIKDDPKLLVFGGALLIIYGIISFIKTKKSFRSIVREHHRIELPKKDFGKLFMKGFLLNFINIGVLLGWLGFIVIGTSITSSENGVLIFITTMLISYFLTDLVKIAAAKRLRSKLTPRLIFKTKKIVSIVILIFGIFLLVQGLFPKVYEKSIEQIERVNPID
ncbi:LysE family translocator [Winogradskyella bathintestinalis]|uniref:LysE family transporter n=1 Tax=Winogradskyella bathintestinalis TaxID=3035208 RepID=A0ABT7ZRC2_9FLAO|nr:LysE family transporter [Winogradskyella bathintestinalis]MDN3491534.1 LysE family transporter [Winogradskyella bathintestinalis]